MERPESNRPALTVIDGGRREIELALVKDIFLNRFDLAEAERLLSPRGRLTLVWKAEPDRDEPAAPHQSA